MARVSGTQLRKPYIPSADSDTLLLTLDTCELMEILVYAQLPYTDNITPLIDENHLGGKVYLTVSALLLIEFCVTQNTDVLVALDKLHVEHLPSDEDGALQAAFCDSAESVTTLLKPLFDIYIPTRHFVYVELRGSLVHVTLSTDELPERVGLTILNDPRYHQINYKEKTYV